MTGKLLPLPESRHFTHQVVIDYTDLTDTAAVTKTIAINPASGTNAAGVAVMNAGFRLDTPFDGASTADLQITVGDTDVDRLIPTTQIHEDATEVDYWVTSHGTATLPYAYTAADTIDIVFTEAAQNLSTLTAGKITIFLAIEDLSSL